ncbi:MAG: zinc ribbon domain-containing protein [Anaerolineae bacterium]|nr:zinc ribbon domain-containing protein [Anaerolineae bacterium]
MSERTYEMLWDCQYCGTNKLLGKTHRFCPNCGAAQDPRSRYYPSEEDKVAVEDHHFVGVDVTCSVCNTLNSADSHFCQNCGAALDESGVAVTKLASQTANVMGEFEEMGSRDVVKEEFDAEMQRVGAAPRTTGLPQQAMDWRVIAFIVAAIVICGGIAFYMLRTEAQTVVVTGHSWERIVTVEEYVSFTTRSWRDSPPAGYNIDLRAGSCTREQRGTRQVQDGETCNIVRSDNGDGTFSEREVCVPRYRSEPVYDDMCTWEGERYEVVNSYTTSGNDIQPFFQPLTLQCEGIQRVGCEQQQFNGTYVIHLQSEDGSHRYTCLLSQAMWTAIAEGDRFTMHVRAVDNSSGDCGSLEAVDGSTSLSNSSSGKTGETD